MSHENGEGELASDRRQPRLRLSPAAGTATLALLFLTLVTARNGDKTLYPPPAGDASAPSTATVYLVDNGFHTDLALPASALAGHLSGRAAAATTARPWVLVGYGDRSFYIGQGTSLERAVDGLRSLFAPGNAAVLRFDGLAATPDKVWTHGVTRVRLTPRGLAAMSAAIDASLTPAADGGPVPVPGAAEPQSGFFVARQPFSLIHLCNHWTAEMLHAAGLPITPVLDTLPAGLKLDLRLRAGVR